MVANAELLEQIGLVHEASVHRNRMLEERLDTFHGELSLIRAALHDRPSLPPVPKTTGQQVASGAFKGAKYTALVVGALGLLVQVASIWRPDLVAPLESLLKLFGAQ